MSNYPYGTGNRLEDRNTYFYSPYLGRDLFIAWQNQRANSLKVTCSIAPGSGLNKPTDVVLAGLLLTLARGEDEPTVWLIIDKLLQRFEVSKRLHGEYNTNWRPVDPTDYDSSERYVLFAELMDLAFQSSGKLQYLNVLLKCMDTLTSCVDRLEEIQLERVKNLARREQDHVEKLANRLGVEQVFSVEQVVI
ncbi:hypothetical protein [Sedimenticola hydrogenitrophicus]|uniref:hypothetical protein n=1 Tax=Sedimenticola hydrogenitrophicus TaxID=2967975 RepID=UPI0023B02DD4|nr:hypothetical protein [Sedimenticola hydrogenitrophicus]